MAAWSASTPPAGESAGRGIRARDRGALSLSFNLLVLCGPVREQVSEPDHAIRAVISLIGESGYQAMTVVFCIGEDVSVTYPMLAR